MPPARSRSRTPDRVRGILEEAGFADVTIEPLRSAMRLAGPGDIAAAVDFTIQIGPTARLVAETEPTDRAALKAALDTALSRHADADGVTLDGAVWIVSARG